MFLADLNKEEKLTGPILWEHTQSSKTTNLISFYKSSKYFSDSVLEKLFAFIETCDIFNVSLNCFMVNIWRNVPKKVMILF